jgi:hypothetical protein
MTDGELFIGGATLILGLATIWLALEARAARREARKLERQGWKRELYGELLERVEIMVGGDSGRPIYTAEERVRARERALALVHQINLVDSHDNWMKAAMLWEQAKNAQDPTFMGWTEAHARKSYGDAMVAFREAAAFELG